MKSGLLFGLYAARALTESKAKGSFCIVYNSEEEIGSRHARSWIEELAKQSRTAVILEPARPNGNLMNERKGLGRIEVTFNGKAAHAGVEPEKGVSAVNEMAYWILGLHSLTDFEKGTTLNAGLVSGGTGANVVPEKASMTVDVRIRIPEEKDRIAAKIAELRANPATPGIYESHSENHEILCSRGRSRTPGGSGRTLAGNGRRFGRKLHCRNGCPHSGRARGHGRRFTFSHRIYRD